jgi:hypothetical protein
MFNKKAQQAMEFMVIFIFVMTLISLAAYVFTVYLIDYEDKNERAKVDNFVQNIENEIAILGKVESGYYRELEIYDRNYFIEIENNTLFLEDSEGIVIDYYEIKGNFTIKVFNKINEYGNIQVISFEK